MNYKTGQSAPVPAQRQVVILNAHKPIISREIFEQAAKIRAEHCCPARMGRENLFRRLLFCDYYGYPLLLGVFGRSISLRSNTKNNWKEQKQYSTTASIQVRFQSSLFFKSVALIVKNRIPIYAAKIFSIRI